MSMATTPSVRALRELPRRAALREPAGSLNGCRPARARRRPQERHPAGREYQRVRQQGRRLPPRGPGRRPRRRQLRCRQSHYGGQSVPEARPNQASCGGRRTTRGPPSARVAGQRTMPKRASPRALPARSKVPGLTTVWIVIHGMIEAPMLVLGQRCGEAVKTGEGAAGARRPSLTPAARRFPNRRGAGHARSASRRRGRQCRGGRRPARGARPS